MDHNQPFISMNFGTNGDLCKPVNLKQNLAKFEKV